MLNLRYTTITVDITIACPPTRYISPPTDGVPHDGTPIKQTVVIAVPLTVVMYLLATTGVVFTLICFGFTVYFRKSKWVLS